MISARDYKKEFWLPFTHKCFDLAQIFGTFAKYHFQSIKNAMFHIFELLPVLYDVIQFNGVINFMHSAEIPAEDMFVLRNLLSRLKYWYKY